MMTSMSTNESTVPIAIEQARLVERLSPDAWIVNFTNPAGLITQAIADSRLLNRQIETALRHIEQMLRLAIDIAHRKSHAGITAPAIQAKADIDADDVAFLQMLLGAGDAVTDHLIH